MLREKILRPKLLLFALLGLGLSSSLWAQGFGECYQLQWGYEYNYRTGEGQSFDPTMLPEGSADEDLQTRDAYVWYCQAKPLYAPTWDVAGSGTRFHSYKAYRLDAQDQATFRCERYASRCTYRCALASKSCAPHFWP